MHLNETFAVDSGTPQRCARFNDEELKHQELIRRIERLIADGMPPGCEFVPQANGVAQAVMGAST